MGKEKKLLKYGLGPGGLLAGVKPIGGFPHLLKGKRGQRALAYSCLCRLIYINLIQQ